MKWLRETRKMQGLTTYQAADRAGITQGYYAMLESGKRLPGVDVAQRLGDMMDFDWRRFYG